MTHTSTGQPEALLVAKWLRETPAEAVSWADVAADHLERLHARVQELEAAQAGRVAPRKLPQVFIDKLAAQHGLDFLTYTPFARAIEKAAHGITQEKQGCGDTR